MSDLPLNQPAEIPPELDRWNWGAFLLNWIWGIGNSTLIALLALIPGVNLIVMVVLGLRGSRWAWRNRAWRDAAQFRQVQRRWAIAGVIVWLLALAAGAGIVSSVLWAVKGSEPYRMTMQAVRDDVRVRAAIGETIETPFWVFGNITVQAGGTGAAQFNIPLSGDKGNGRVLSRALRTNGAWSLRLVIVNVDGNDVPIVLENADRVQVPNAPVDL